MRLVWLHQRRTTKSLASFDIIFFIKITSGILFLLWKFHSLPSSGSHCLYPLLQCSCPLTLIPSRQNVAAVYSLGCSSSLALSPFFSWLNSLQGLPGVVVVGGGPNTGPYLSHTVISPSPSEAHYKKALVFKNTLHVEISYTHTYTHHTHTYGHTYSRVHTQHWHISTPTVLFFCIEIPLPSLDPAQSHHLGEDLIKFPKTKTLGDKRWKDNVCRSPPVA